MSNEQRLDVHDKRLDHHDERFNIHAARIDKSDLLLFGDAKLGIKGIVQSMSEMSDVLRGLVEWRTQLETYARAVVWVVRIVVTLLGLTVLGVWWPQLQWIVKLLGG